MDVAVKYYVCVHKLTTHFTVEQAVYLEFLPHTATVNNTLDPCVGCSSDEIVLPYNFPFGGYFHEKAFVSF